MIDPENSTPLHESENDPEDQQSQQDVHSDGLEGDDNTEDDAPDVTGLQAADRASEAAFTLDVDRGIAPRKKDKEDGNLKS